MSNLDGTVGDLLRDTASRLFQDACTPTRLRDADRGLFPVSLWAAVAEAGLHRALVPEHAGGFGVAVGDALSLLRVAAEFAVPLPLAETMLASRLLADAGLPIPEGPLTIAPVLAGETLTLTQVEGGWRLDGVAGRIPWGRNAAAAAVVAVQDGQARVALVRREAWRFEAGENVAREPRDTLFFAGAAAEVGRTAIAPATLRAWGAAMRTQQIAGGLVRLTEMTTQYAQDRVQFGRPIGKFQAVQQNMAVLAGQAAAATAAADIASDALAEWDMMSTDAASDRALLPIAAGKARASEAVGVGTSIAHQVHGAIGFTFEHSLHFTTRRLWSWRDEFGAETEWNRLVGRHMLAAGADRLWAEITAA